MRLSLRGSLPLSEMTIFDKVVAFIGQPECADFDHLALEVFHHQVDHVEAYGEYCRSIGAIPATVRDPEDIPFVSTVAFKHARLAVAPAERFFLTSGTTEGTTTRGQHFVPRLDVYRASAMRHFKQMVLPDRSRIRILALHPTADRMPESSLAQMVSWCIEDFGERDSLCVATSKSVSIDEAIQFLRATQRAKSPVCVLATTAAGAALFDSIAADGNPLALAHGSRIMDTGGAKGRQRPLSRAEMIEGAERWLGIDAQMVINEYGMTEMCSQLYDVTPFNAAGLDERYTLQGSERRGFPAKFAPHWVRPRAFDPVSLRPLPWGETGLLGFFDLANVGSVSAIITEDIGMVDGQTVFVLGRAGDEPRGCALGISEFASREVLS